MKKATLQDIARYAGVSPAAVSYYFMRKKTLSEAVALKIEEGAKLYNYTPVHTGTAAAQKPKKLIMMCFILEEKDMRDDVYFLGMMNGVMDCLSENGYQFIINRLVSTDAVSRELFTSGLEMVDGVILCNPPMDTYFEDELQKSEMPYVVLGSSEMGESAFYVDVDMQGVGFQAANFFLAKGYKRILYINLPEFMLQSKQRRQGFVLAYKRRGLAWDDSGHIFLPISADRCYEAVMERFLTERPWEAIVTSNELQALGVIRAMKELKIDIPGKLELSSMGGTLLGTLSTPTLTTIDFDSHKNGYEAALMLLDILGKKRIAPFHLILPGHFVERGSTKKTI